MDYIDEMVNGIRSRFDRSKLRIIRDNLGLKSGFHGGRLDYSINCDSGYIGMRLYAYDAEVREYDHNGKVFVFFGYDDKAGAWGGYTRKYEVKDTDIFKTPRWKSIIQIEGVKASPDVIMF